MAKFQRVIGIVLDSFGIGAAPDAANFNDQGADTLGHIIQGTNEDFQLPNLAKLGLFNIRAEDPAFRAYQVPHPVGSFGKMAEISAGKDSMDGHFEMMGVPVTEELGFFPEGFPAELLQKIEEFSGRKVIVNRPYSGTEVIKDYGERQLETGELIVYTSGDSVLQIAANTAVIPLAELYRISEFARELTKGAPYHIGRIIARPYVGTNKNNFERTSDRRDYALLPSDTTDMQRLQDAGIEVTAVGKINDIFSGVGITRGYHTTSNHQGMGKVIELVKDPASTGFIFANLVDFDAMYGHRRNIAGYAAALADFDTQLDQLISVLNEDDLLFITADHGNDPGFRGTDHTREYVPILFFSKALTGNQNLGIRTTFSDLGQTILENFDVQPAKHGTSFLTKLI